MERNNKIGKFRKPKNLIYEEVSLRSRRNWDILENTKNNSIDYWLISIRGSFTGELTNIPISKLPCCIEVNSVSIWPDLGG